MKHWEHRAEAFLVKENRRSRFRVLELLCWRPIDLVIECSRLPIVISIISKSVSYYGTWEDEKEGGRRIPGQCLLVVQGVIHSLECSLAQQLQFLLLNKLASKH